MPPALTKKMFGLPRWAWLLILAVAIGVGLYLRHKKAEEEKAESETTGEEQPVPVGAAGPETAAYESGGVQGGGEYYPSAEGYYPSPFPAEGPEAEAPPTSVTVNVGAAPLPSATDGATAPASSAGGSGTPCSHPKPKAKAGGHYECVSGKWKWVAQTPHNPTVVSGGGPPNKPNNKGPKIGVGGGQALPPAQAAGHPNAVDTGNPCVNGGVGKHTAPPGYHLFCQNGKIWRAPNN